MGGGGTHTTWFQSNIKLQKSRQRDIEIQTHKSMERMESPEIDHTFMVNWFSAKVPNHFKVCQRSVFSKSSDETTVYMFGK